MSTNLSGYRGPMPPPRRPGNNEFPNNSTNGIPRLNEPSSDSRDREVSPRERDSSPEEGEISPQERNLFPPQRFLIPQRRDSHHRERGLGPERRSSDVRSIDSYRPQGGSSDVPSIDSYRPQGGPRFLSRHDNRADRTHRTTMTNVTRGGGIGGRAFFEQKYGRPEVYGPEQFRPGTIIHATQYEEAWPSRETESNAATLVIGEAGQKISTKSRFLIVVAQNKSCYTTVPVYTHNGKGLTDNHVKDEHVSIRDHKIPEKDFKPLTEHAPLVTQDLKEPTKIMDLAAAWLAYPVSKPYWVPVKLVGHLEDDSTKQLTDLYQRFMKVKDESPLSPSQFPPLSKQGSAEPNTGNVKSVKLSDNVVLHAPVEKETDTAEKLNFPPPSQNSSLGKQGSAEPETGSVTSVKRTENAVMHPPVERRRDAVEKTTLLTPSRNSSLGKRRSAEPETASVKSVKLRDNDSAVGRGRDAVEKMTLKSVSSQSYAAALNSAAPKGRDAVKKKTVRTTTRSQAHAPHLLSGLGFGHAAAERAAERANASEKGGDVWRR